MTGRGPIFWGQPEYTVGRSAEHDLSGRASLDSPAAPKLYDHSWPDPPKLSDHWVYTGLLRPAVAIRAGPAKIIRPLGIHWTTAPTEPGGRQKLYDHGVYTGLLRSVQLLPALFVCPWRRYCIDHKGWRYASIMAGAKRPQGAGAMRRAGTGFRQNLKSRERKGADVHKLYLMKPRKCD